MDDIEELRKEVATLTNMVQRLQPPTKGNDKFEDTQTYFENPFSTLNRRRFEHKWERNIKIEIPKLFESLDPRVFVDCLNAVERVFDYGDVSEDKKVKLVSIRLKGRASAWWEQMQMNRQRRGNGKIRDWEKMKKKLKEKFMPFNYTQPLYKNLHNLKQVGNVDDYTEAFYQLVARVDLNEIKEHMVARYISGLKPSIQNVFVHLLHYSSTYCSYCWLNSCF